MAVLVGYVAVSPRFAGPHKFAAAKVYLGKVEQLLRTEGFLLPAHLQPGQQHSFLDGLVVARKGTADDCKQSGAHANKQPDFVLTFPDLKLANGRDSLKVCRLLLWGSRSPTVGIHALCSIDCYAFAP